MENEANNGENIDKETRIYEVGYLLVPTISEESLSEEVGVIKNVVIENKGVIIAEEMPKSKPLAYEMSKNIANKICKFNTAYFGWVKFGANSDMVLNIKDQLDKNSNILRHLIIKTVREDTLAKKPIIKRKIVKKSKSQDESKEEVQTSVEEMDKTIEELVID